jgi:hypothetical protein
MVEFAESLQIVVAATGRVSLIHQPLGVNAVVVVLIEVLDWYFDLFWLRWRLLFSCCADLARVTVAYFPLF